MCLRRKKMFFCKFWYQNIENRVNITLVIVILVFKPCGPSRSHALIDLRKEISVLEWTWNDKFNISTDSQPQIIYTTAEYFANKL